MDRREINFFISLTHLCKKGNLGNLSIIDSQNKARPNDLKITNWTKMWQAEKYKLRRNLFLEWELSAMHLLREWKLAEGVEREGREGREVRHR